MVAVAWVGERRPEETGTGLALLRPGGPGRAAEREASELGASKVGLGAAVPGTPRPRVAQAATSRSRTSRSSTSLPAVVALRSGRQFFWRRLLALALMGVVAALAWFAAGLLARAGAAPGAGVRAPSHVELYVARPGDTVWQVAVRFSGGADPWPLAEQLEAEIGGGTLQPGQVLSVP